MTADGSAPEQNAEPLRGRAAAAVDQPTDASADPPAPAPAPSTAPARRLRPPRRWTSRSPRPSGMFALGLAVPAFSTPSMTVLQETVEPEMQGRVFGFVGIVMALAMPVGMAVFGPLADRFTVQSLLVVAGVALFAVVGLAVALPSGRRSIAAAGRHAS